MEYFFNFYNTQVNIEYNKFLIKGNNGMETNSNIYNLYEDKLRKSKIERKNNYENKYSPYCDFIYYESSITPGIKLAMRVLKPEKPSYILATTHGWHMSAPDFEAMEKPSKDVKYLTLQIDMRGRAFSDGNPDCNGWELYDVIDAVNYAKKHYSEYILNKDLVYLEAGSGGGGNVYALLGKFPDFFAAATALYGISDYAKWYENDAVGEFKDEMDIWIGSTPKENLMAYRSRSGLYCIENLCTPLVIIHGEKDVRVPVTHAREYVERGKHMGKSDLIKYIELKSVGGKAHLENVTKEQIKNIQIQSEKNRINNRVPISIPEKGKMIVAGYLFTKEFSIILDSIDKVATLDYDLKNEYFNITCSVDCDYKFNRFEKKQ